MQGTRFVTVSVVFYCALAAACAVWDLLSDSVDLRVFGGTATNCAAWLLAGGATGAAVAAGSRLAVSRWSWADGLARRLAPLLGQLTAGQALAVAAASAAGEELLFRGCLLQSWGLIPSVLVFGVLHGFFLPGYVAWTIFALVLGLAWGIMVQACGGVAPAVVSHLLVNYLNIRLLGGLDLAEGP